MGTRGVQFVIAVFLIFNIHITVPLLLRQQSGNNKQNLVLYPNNIGYKSRRGTYKVGRPETPRTGPDAANEMTTRSIGIHNYFKMRHENKKYQQKEKILGHDPGADLYCPNPCRCNLATFDITCGRDLGTLTYVPLVPQKTKSLTLKQMQIKTLTDNIFTRLKVLEVLYIPDSLLIEHIEKHTFFGLHNLKELNLNGTTHLETIQSELSLALTDINGLETFSLSNCVFQRFPAGILAQLPYLKTLDISFNYIKTIKINRNTAPLKHLKRLNLQSNDINFIHASFYKFVPNITYIRLSKNKLKSVKDLSTGGLKHTQLQELYLDENLIQILDKGVFRSLKQLKVLNICDNQLIQVDPFAFSGIKKLRQFMFKFKKDEPPLQKRLSRAFGQIPGLKALRLGGKAMDSLPEALIFAFENLTTIDLSDCNISQVEVNHSHVLNYVLVLKIQFCAVITIHPSVYSAFPNLSVLGLRGNKIKNIAEQLSLQTITSLKLNTLDLSRNYIRDIPKCAFKGLETLTHLNLSFNRVEYLDKDGFRGLEGLKILDLSNNNIWKVTSSTFKNIMSLQFLSLRNCSIYFVVTKLETYQMNSLSYLDISNNKDFFHGSELWDVLHLPNLKVLKLSKLNRGYEIDSSEMPALEELDMSHDTIEKLSLYTFSKRRRIRILDLSYNELTYLDNMLADLPDLSKLNLNNNKLREFPLLHPISKISVIKLARNKITFINATHLYNMKHLIELDLSENSLTCNCDLMPFRKWIQVARVYIADVAEPGQYMCNRTSNLLDFMLTESECQLLDFVTLVAASTSAFIFLTLVIGAVYRYRWNLRYRWYLLCRRKRGYQPVTDDARFLYDAFLSYNKADEDWAVDVLLYGLEEEDPHFRLCVHERDFEPGKDISENIVESMVLSRKIIFVISENFLRSQWCMFEMEIAQHNLLCKNKDNIILVVLEDVSAYNMSTTLRLHMSTRTYLKWTDNPRGERLFWQKLRDYLTKPDVNVVDY